MIRLRGRWTASRPVWVTPLLWFASLFGAVSFACAAAVGDQVELRATHQAGVPFHNTPGGGQTFRRVPRGTVGTVTELARDGRWLQLRLAAARTGWVSARYVGRTIAGPSAVDLSAERTVWTSPEGRQQVVGSGGRMAPADSAILRVGAWNIRWFPRGCPSNRTCPEQTTDLPWLACTIAWMNVDVLAMQEILATADAEFSLNALRSELDRLTGGSWQVDQQACGGTSDQHIGFLWNGSRVALLQLTDTWELNGAATGPTGSACAGNLRPGRYALAHTPIGKVQCVISTSMLTRHSMRRWPRRRPWLEGLLRHGSARWCARSPVWISPRAGRRHKRRCDLMILAAMAHASCCVWMNPHRPSSSSWSHSLMSHERRLSASFSHTPRLTRFPRAGTCGRPNGVDASPSIEAHAAIAGLS
jgi:hypothetical protein